jgi:hypothetical protein
MIMIIMVIMIMIILTINMKRIIYVGNFGDDDTDDVSYLAGMSPYISLKIKKRHYEHHMIEAHKYLITWISDDISFENSG